MTWPARGKRSTHCPAICKSQWGSGSRTFAPSLARRRAKGTSVDGRCATSARLAISQIVPDPDQPRAEFSQEALERLALSIREKGQLSPIRVRWSEELEKWTIICGERRWRAMVRAGLAEIDCYFDEGESVAFQEILEQQLIENCLREDLQPIEEAEAFASLMKLNGWTGKQVADALTRQSDAGIEPGTCLAQTARGDSGESRYGRDLIAVGV